MSGDHGLSVPPPGDEPRPDGRSATSETRALRRATRALRYHLDTLPVDYDLAVSADRFLARLAFPFARQRYGCADSMIGAGFGGTVLGAMARSLLDDGLRWLWIGDQPERGRALLGALLEERNRICIALEKDDVSCGNLPRWLMPLPDVADLTGNSLSWLDVPSMPSEDELLHHFLIRPANDPPPSPGDASHTALLGKVRTLLNMSGLRGAVLILAHAGHGNYLGLQSSLTNDGTPGHDLRADHEALFMQVAAVGVVATLLGTAATTPEAWPLDVEQEPFLQRAVELVENVTVAAVAIHGLGTSRRVVTLPKKNTSSRTKPLLRPGAVLAPEDLYPDINSADEVIAEAETYVELARSLQVKLEAHGESPLHAIVAFGGAHSGLQTVISTYDKPGSAVIGVFAARMLLEEAARMGWRYSAGEAEAFKARAKHYFDEYRTKRKKTIALLVSSGVPVADAQKIFSWPDKVRVVTPDDEIDKGRPPLPAIGRMLRQMGERENYPEPGWLGVAYSLLSQITHSTPIGHLHAMRHLDGEWRLNELSPEMLGLTLDVACLGSAHTIGLSAAVLTNMSDETTEFMKKLHRQAAVVHNAARLVHGLD